MSFVIALSLILHPELLLGEGKTSVSKTGQKPPTSCGCSCQSRLRATSQAPFSSVRGKSHSDLRKVGFGTLDSCLVYHCCLIKKDAIKIPPERGCNSGCNRRGLQGQGPQCGERARRVQDRQATPLPRTSCPRARLCPVAVTSDPLRPAGRGRLRLALAHSLPPGQGSVMAENQCVSSTQGLRPLEGGAGDQG